MPGIIFFKTENLERISSFYEKEMGMTLWLDQGACRILQKDNMLLGLCSSEKTEREGVVTFFFESKQEVDAIYKSSSIEKITDPKENKKFKIYNFFAKDPEGRTLEFQTFLSEIAWKF